MCLFPSRAPRDSIAFKKGIEQFNCGSCPECLKTRAGMWALRAVYEAKCHKHSLMITLTYDSYIRENGRIVGEQVADRHVDVSDCQKFIKRVRKHFDKQGVKIKYIIAAEYGKRTHRPHYHVLLFGAWFDDIIFYKRSKRGNPIYKSKTLNALWGNGICTVDKRNVTVSAARYCTKYLAKDKGAEDTFQLFSHGLGVVGLEKDFNGLYYMLEGRKYPIPRIIWRRYIERKYSGTSFKYVNPPKEPSCCPSVFPAEQLRQVIAYARYERDKVRYERSLWRLEYSRYVQEHDVLFKRYVSYWRARVEENEQSRPNVRDRICLLPDEKYFAYKKRALSVLELRARGVPFPAPRTRQRLRYIRYLYEHRIINSDRDLDGVDWANASFCRCLSRPATANDTAESEDRKNQRKAREFDLKIRSAQRATLADLKIFDDL